MSDVEITGHLGENPLSDYPHARHHCVVFPLRGVGGFGGAAAAAATHCPNCFCWVCDTPVAACTSWTKHCLAKPDDPIWQERRRRVQQSKVSSPLPETAAAPLPAVPVVVIPADTPHGVHAQHLNPIAAPGPIGVSVVERAGSRPAQRNLRGTYCVCDVIDNELGALRTQNFKLKRHSVIS